MGSSPSWKGTRKEEEGIIRHTSEEFLTLVYKIGILEIAFQFRGVSL